MNEENDKFKSIIRKFFEIEEDMKEIENIKDDIVYLQDRLDDSEVDAVRLMDIQTQQLDRLNKNAELIAAILGEISVSLASQKE